MDNISGIFVINLPECKTRMAAFDETMKKLGLIYTVRPAIKGGELSRADLNKFTSYWCRHFTCTNGLIGCYLSHLFLWKDLTRQRDKKIKWYLILEDDSHLTPDFIINVSGIFQDLRNWNYDNKFPEYINCASSIGNLERVSPHLRRGILVNGTSAYLVSDDGIEKLVKNMDKRINYHVDLTLSWDNLWYDDLHFYCTKNFVINSDNNTSTISNSYPKLIPWLISFLYNFSGINNHYHIIYESSLIVFHRFLSVNITIVFYIILIAMVLTHNSLFLWCLCWLIVLCELILVIVSKKQVGC